MREALVGGREKARAEQRLPRGGRRGRGSCQTVRTYRENSRDVWRGSLGRGRV